jgi:hypothetical protein
MPDDLRQVDRDQDPYAWAVAQAALIAKGDAALAKLDFAGLKRLLEEVAEDMLSTLRSQLVNLMAHAAKVAHSANPGIIGHWRTECAEFHDRIVDAYRPSMRRKLDLEALWRRARRKVLASFADHGEPPPVLPAKCPFRLDELIDDELDVETLVATLRKRGEP